MLLLALAVWTLVATSSATVSYQGVSHASAAPEVFFGLHTYPPTMYDGMERYGCEDSHCREIVEVNTDFAIGKLSDGRFIELNRAGQTRHPPVIGSLSEASRGRLTQWQAAAAPPAEVPEIANYRLSVSRPVFWNSSYYVGLWQNLRAGTPRQTLVVLFDGRRREAGSNLTQSCGPYIVLAVVDQRVDILESRQIYHIGYAVNLASYDEGAKTIWIARMILSEHEPICHR